MHRRYSMLTPHSQLKINQAFTPHVKNSSVLHSSSPLKFHWTASFLLLTSSSLHPQSNSNLTVIWAPITAEQQLISQKIKCQRQVSTQIKAPAKAHLSWEGWMMVVVQLLVEADCPRMCRPVTFNEIIISLIHFKRSWVDCVSLV